MKHQRIPPSVLLWVMVITAIFVTSCATTTDFVTGQRTHNFYSVQDDIKLGNASFEEMKVQMAKDGTAVSSRNADDVRRVKEISSRIFAATGQQDIFAFEVELFESKVVNAFAVPGGKIAIFTGLWDPKEGLVTDDDELAAVIAHEVGHVTCRHSTEEMTRQMPTQLLLAAAGLYAESQEDETWKSVVDSAFLVYNGLVVPKYSRANEFEADRVSMEYMERAGFDPAAAVRLWKRAYDQEGNEPGYMSILATHPSNRARYEALQRQLSTIEAQRGAPLVTPTTQPAQTGVTGIKPTTKKPEGVKTIFASPPAAALAPVSSPPHKVLAPETFPAPLK